ncbi:MAG: amidohydrolase [Acidimicrobiia bacterium]
MSPGLAIRGGTVVDGRGTPPYRADVGVDDGRIAEIAATVRARHEIDATGHLVMPGFVDLHTHYDPQVLWDPELTPSTAQGVTAVVAGNCGFSLAPCPPEMRASLLRTLDGVEDMRVSTLRAGIEWTFESHPEYLRRVAERGTGANFGGYIGHTALRLAVMGDAAYEREASPSELEAMRTVVGDALDGGALGFSTDRSGFHRGDGGRPVPSAVAHQDEVVALMLVTREAQRGIVHCAPGERFHWLYDLQPRLGRPITWSAILTYPRDTAARAWWADKVAFHRAHYEQGVDVHPQVTCRPVTFRISMQEPSPFYLLPAFARVKAAEADARVRIYTDEGWRTSARDELDAGRHMDPRWDNFSVAECTIDARLVGRPIGEIAADRRRHPLDVVLDLAVEDPGARFSVTFANDDPDGVRALLTTEGCVLGLSDAGAHVSQVCDAALPTDFLAHWVRDQHVMPLAAGVRRLTGEPAELLGLRDRGHVTPGHWADLVVVDWERLDPGPIRRVHDLPGGGDRLVCDQPAGIAHVVVNGVPTVQEGRRVTAGLDRLPGRVLDNAPGGDP